MIHLNPEGQILCNDQLITHWYYMASKAKRILKSISILTRYVHQEEWRNSKVHYIRIVIMEK